MFRPLFSPYVSFADFSGSVASVIDGDTIDVLHERQPERAERVRLSGINCSEKCQAFGKRAKLAASEMVFGKEVTIQSHGHEKYKRFLGDVILPDGMSLNQ